MSNLTYPITGDRESPVRGLREELHVGTGPSLDADIASDGSEEGEIREDQPIERNEIQGYQPTEGKRKRSTSDDGQPDPKRAQPGLHFKRIKNPSHEMPCVISINEREPIGSLYPAESGLRPWLYIDAGRSGDQTVSLSFRSIKENSRRVAQNFWQVDWRLNSWAMKDFEHGYAAPNADDPRMSLQTVLADCNESDMANMMYMRFTSWPQSCGFHHKHAFQYQSGSIQKSMKIMFKPQGSYLLEFWFITPFNSADLRRKCLRYFDEGLANRTHPQQTWVDTTGAVFSEIAALQPPVFSSRNTNREPFRMPSSKEPKGLLNTSVEQARRARTAQYTGTDFIESSSTKDNQVEQSTSESQLAFAMQDQEHPKPAGARDFTMSDRSPSQPIEAQPAVIKDAMMTSETISLPASSFG